MMGHIRLWITRIGGRNHGTLLSMSFQNLAPTWATQPLSDPALAADVVDLMVSLGERRRGTFTAVLCDHDDRYIATVSIDLPTEFKHQEPSLRADNVCGAALNPIIPALRTTPDAALILALGRPGPAVWPDLDTEWSQAATHICAAAQVRLLAFYIASPTHIYQPPTRTPAAA
jgi:hypothetical protein